MRGSKRLGIETVVKNNGERIMKKLRYRGGVYIEVWRIGLSEHTKEEEECSSIALCFFLYSFLFHSGLSHFILFVLQLYYFQAISVALFIYKSKCIDLQWPVLEPNNVQTAVWNAWILTTGFWSSAANGRLSEILTFIVHVSWWTKRQSVISSSRSVKLCSMDGNMHALKIYLLNAQFKIITDFSAMFNLVYVKQWKEAPLATRTLLNDINFLTILKT